MNVVTGRIFEDRGWTLADPEATSPSLVRAVYENKQFTPREDLKGLYRYAEWMPIKRTLKKSCAPVTYHSKGLGKFLGLDNLYITFSGYNPKIGVPSRRPRPSAYAQGWTRKKNAPSWCSPPAIPHVPSRRYAPITISPS